MCFIMTRYRKPTGVLLKQGLVANPQMVRGRDSTNRKAGNRPNSTMKTNADIERTMMAMVLKSAILRLARALSV